MIRKFLGTETWRRNSLESGTTVGGILGALIVVGATIGGYYLLKWEDQSGTTEHIKRSCGNNTQCLSLFVENENTCRKVATQSRGLSDLLSSTPRQDSVSGFNGYFYSFNERLFVKCLNDRTGTPLFKETKSKPEIKIDHTPKRPVNNPWEAARNLDKNEPKPEVK